MKFNDYVKNVKEFIKNHLEKILLSIIFLLSFMILLVVIYKKFNKNDIKTNVTEQVSLINKIVEEDNDIIEEKEMIHVDVKGAINNPGVYLLESNSIVNDAINLAGGIREDANTREINLSKKLKDEMVIIIYTNEEIEEFKEKKETKTECICDKDINDVCAKEVYSNSYDYNETFSDNVSSNKIEISGVVNINTASLEELLTISGIGESKANAIIEYRKENKFEVIEDIMKVSGIGESLFNKIKENITV